MTRQELKTEPALDIDAIVREVLAQLAGSQLPANTSAANGNGELLLTEKVVSAADLKDRLNGIGRVVLRRGAIVTPAARDLLRQGSVSLAYQSGTNASVKGNLVVGVAETAYDAAPLVRAVGQCGLTIERLAKTGLSSVVDEMCDLVRLGGQLGLMLTGQPAAAICLANRRAGVRAALATHPAATAAAVQSVGANLLVAEPVGRSFFELKQTIQEFAGHGVRSCPENLRERLG